MRFDGSLFWHPGVPTPWDKQVEENREYAKLMEHVGFTTAWSCEHHLWHDRRFACTPNSVLTCLDIASHTKHLRVGQSPVSIPDRHPLLVAEDIAILDNMTKGRVEFGVARGLDSRWGAQYHPAADRSNDAQNRALFQECLDIIIKAWTEEVFTYKGEFYTFPVPGWKETDPVVKLEAPYYSPDGELIAINVLPKPYQKPHPPVWLMVSSNASWAFSGAKGHGAIGSARSLEGIREAFTVYKEAANSQGHDVGLGENISCQFMVYCAKTMEEAITDASGGLNWMFGPESVGQWAQRAALLEKGANPDNDDLNSDWSDFLMKHKIALIGTPDFISEHLQRLQEEVNFRHFQLFPSIPFLTFRQAMSSLELFAAKVMPLFRESEKEEAVAAS